MGDSLKNHTNIGFVSNFEPRNEKLCIPAFLYKKSPTWCFLSRRLLPVLLFIAFFTPTKYVAADAIGMSAIATPHIGYAAGIANVKVDDPEGPTDRTWTFEPFTLIFTDKITGGFPYRYWTELFYQEISFNASTVNIGQFVKQYGIRASMQRKVWKTDVWNTWFGAGLNIADTQYEDRHLIDSEGFLTTQFDNRKQVELGVLVNFFGEISLARNVVFSAKVEQIFATSNGLNSLSFAAIFLYRL